MGWRYQIFPLVELGFRVIVPDLLGFGRTVGNTANIKGTCMLIIQLEKDAPFYVESYSHKNCADDIKELASQLAPSEKIIVCGHDKYGIHAPTS